MLIATIDGIEESTDTLPSEMVKESLKNLENKVKVSELGETPQKAISSILELEKPIQQLQEQPYLEEARAEEGTQKEEKREKKDTRTKQVTRSK